MLLHKLNVYHQMFLIKATGSWGLSQQSVQEQGWTGQQCVTGHTPFTHTLTTWHHFMVPCQFNVHVFKVKGFVVTPQSLNTTENICCLEIP